MIRTLFLALLFITPALADPCNAPLPTTPGTQFGGVVDYIVDGDGICVSGIEVRLGDFNAPELREPGGKEAKAAMSKLALGKHVDCISCVGARSRCRSYDRVIAVCAMEGVSLGDRLRALGIAEGGR